MSGKPAGERKTGSAAGHSPVVSAVLAMLAAGLCSSLLHIGVRIVSPVLPTIEIVFLRSLFTLMATLPFVLRPANVAWRTNAPGLQVVRGVVGVTSITAWYFALGQMPLADAAALSFTTGLFVTAGAALAFGEAVGMRRWSAVLVGFLGALIVLRPGAGVVSWAAISAVASSALWAGSLLLAKQLARTDSSLTITFWQPLMTTPLALLATIPYWVWPEVGPLMILMAMGVVAAAGNYCYIHAIRTAEAAIVMPADYVRLVWMAGWGFLFFAEVPLLSTWIGAALIIGATLFITIRESRLAAERRRRWTEARIRT